MTEKRSEYIIRLRAKAGDLPAGKDRFLLRKEILEREVEEGSLGTGKGNQRWIFDARVRLVSDALRASFFDEAFLEFIQAWATFNQHIGEQDFELYRKAMMGLFGWSVEYVSYRSKISRSQIDVLFDEYELGLRESGLSFSPLYKRKAEVAMELGDLEDAKVAYQKFDCIRHEYTGCEACVVNFDVHYQNYIGRFDRAIVAAEVALSGRLSCDSTPVFTYIKLANASLRTADPRGVGWFEDGWKRLDFAEMDPLHKFYFVFSVAHNMEEKSDRLFHRLVEGHLKTRDDYDKLMFANAACVFFEKKEKKGQEFLFPSSLFEAVHIKNPSPAYLAQYFSKLGEGLSMSFDRRNKNTYISARSAEMKKMLSAI